jgi:tetratricopeptide (TPR) repeat protein
VPMKKPNKNNSNWALAADPPASQAVGEKRPFRVLLFSLVILATVVVYSNSCKNGFVNWDDDLYVYNNPDIRHLDGKTIHKFFTAYFLKMYEPVTMISYALDYKIGKLNPVTYHCTNLIIHLANVSLVFYLILLLTKRAGVAAITALFFGIHPLHVESVAWISERKDLLYGLFYLCSLISYFYYRSRDGRFRYYSLAILFFCLSLLSKSAAVTLPLILLLMDYYLGRRLTLKNNLDKIPFFLLSVSFGILSLISQRVIGNEADYVVGYTLLDRVFLGVYSFVFYLVRSVLPFGLSALHPLPSKNGGALPLKYYLSGFAFMGFAALLVKLFKSDFDERVKREILFGLLFFIFTIGLVLFVPVGQAVVAERYTYVPYIGLFLIIGRAYYYIQQRRLRFFPSRHYYSAGVLGFMMIFFAFTTYGRNAAWLGTSSLFSDVIRKDPGSGLAYNNRGNMRSEQGNFTGAMEDYDKAIELKYKDAYNNRGILRNKLKDYTNAIRDFNEALNSNFEREKVYYNRGIARMNLGDYKGAEEDFGRAIAINPQYSNAYINRGFIRYEKLSDYKGSIADLNQAVALDPADPDVYYNRGNAKLRWGRWGEAVSDYDHVLQMSPGYVGAYFNKGVALLNMKNTSGACLNWNRASELGAVRAVELIRIYCR